MIYKYILHGFYQANLLSPLKQAYGEYKKEDKKWLDVPMNFKLEFDNMYELTNHLLEMSWSKGTHTFIIEVEDRETGTSQR